MEHYKSNKGAKRPYRVGKGKPPIEHQFKKGQPSPNPRGRPKGSTKTSTLQKLLSKVVIANSPDGRRVRKTLGEVIDHKLVEMAAKGDFKAIKLIKEIELKCRQLALTDRPSADDLAKDAAELEPRKALLAKLTGLLDEQGRRKKEGAPRFRPKASKGDDPDGHQETA
jgi:hypothetical protein